VETAADILETQVAINLQQALRDIEEQRAATLALLKAVGDEGRCKGCGAAIYWIKHRNGRRAPYEASTGRNHFIGCPNAADFKKKG
jgi:hypothetical protein